MGLNLSDEDIAALEERTEGWIAGLQLAALSMRDRKDISGFIRAFSGSHRDVLDYLAEEVLERQAEQVRAFLLETSISEHLRGTYATRLPAAMTGKRCWRGSRGRTSSSLRWTTSGAGTATITSSPISCAAASCAKDLIARASYT